VENRVGATGTIGAEAVVRAPPDGYTLLFTADLPITLAPALLKLRYDPQRDLAPVAALAKNDNLVVVHPSAGIRSLADLVAAAKLKPGALTFASGGNASPSHLCGEMLKRQAGIDVHQKVKTTTVYVTHDQVEAMTLADRVVVMNGGRIEQIGRPQELYHRPKTHFVAGFIGSPAMNFLPARLQPNGEALLLRLAPELAFPIPAAHAARYRAAVGKDLVFGLRPEHITEPRGQERDPRCEFSRTVDVIEPMGMETMVFFMVNGTEVCARVEPSAAVAPGQPMRLYANLNHMHLIDPSTELAL
jgi:tripartite tricarboxylate transporter family receptor/MalK-like protein